MGSPCELRKERSSYLTGTLNINDENKYVIFSIPYENDWHIFVDGKSVYPEKVLSALMGVPVEKGIHSIELKYIPKGMYIGIVLSCTSIILLIFILLYLRKERKRLAKWMI